MGIRRTEKGYSAFIKETYYGSYPTPELAAFVRDSEARKRNLKCTLKQPTTIAVYENDDATLYELKVCEKGDALRTIWTSSNKQLAHKYAARMGGPLGTQQIKEVKPTFSNSQTFPLANPT